MPATPYSKLLVSIASGPTTSGGVAAAAGDTVQLSGESTAQWTSQTFEIYDFPTGFSCPAGWSTSASGTYQYSSSSVPPSFALLSGSNWGKYMLRLVVNGGIKNGTADSSLTDDSTSLSVPSPILGMQDIGYQETNQFSTAKKWIAAVQSDLRLLDTAAGTSAGVVPATADTICKRGAAGQGYFAWLGLSAVSAPSTPGSGHVLWSDSDGNCYIKDSLGRVTTLNRTMKLTNSKTLVGNNATVAVPLFHVTGLVRVVKLYAVVTTVLGSNITAAYWRLNDQTVQTDITLATGTTLSSKPVGTVLLKLDEETAALAALSSAAGFAGSPVSGDTSFDEFLVNKKAGATTDIEFVYTTTNTPTSGVILFFIEYEPLGSDGALTAA